MRTKRYREEMGLDSMKLANLLMQLASGGEDIKRRRRSTSPAGRVFECMTCGRQFPSFQALGGHRASHKKPKVSVVDHDRAEETCSLKPKVHECSICGLQFAMGQALGGHMRRHRASAEGLIYHGFAAEKKPSDGKMVLLDLNLPPLEEEGENRILGISLGLGLGLVC